MRNDNDTEANGQMICLDCTRDVHILTSATYLTC